MGGDLASTKPRFQAVAHWLRRSVATCKEDYRLASRCEWANIGIRFVLPWTASVGPPSRADGDSPKRR